jgi:hypothetical protein
MFERAKAWNGETILPPLTDSGANPDDAYTALTLYGCQSTADECGELGPSSKLTAYEEAHVNDEIVGEELIADSTFRLVGQFEIMSIGQDRLDAVAQAIASKFAVGISVYASDDRFQGYTGGLMAGPPAGFFPDHWVYITKFYTDASGHRVYGLVNSWGELWGIGGEFLACEAVILAADCLMVASVAEVAT